MKDYDRTTVAGVANFPVQDITHKPKRQQGDMIRLKQLEEQGVEEQGVEEPTVTEQKDSTLKIITLERAISYYKRMSADPKNGKLYEATAKWLEELLVTRTVKTSGAVKALNSEEDNNADS